MTKVLYLDWTTKIGTRKLKRQRTKHPDAEVEKIIHDGSGKLQVISKTYQFLIMIIIFTEFYTF